MDRVLLIGIRFDQDLERELVIGMIVDIRGLI